MDYDIASANSTMITSLTTEIQRRLKSVCERRYRLIVQVFFIENNDQDVQVGSKVLFRQFFKFYLDFSGCGTQNTMII